MGTSPFSELLDKRHQLQEDRPQDAAICFDLREMDKFVSDSRIASSNNASFAKGVVLPVLEIVEEAPATQNENQIAITDTNREKTQVKSTKFFDLAEPQISRIPQDLLPASSVLRPLFYPDWPLNHTLRPDGTIKTEQAHPDGSIRIHSRFANGTSQERITDRYARPFYVCDIAKDGKWTVSELAYQDNYGRISPFVASRKITSSDGLVTEEHYNDFGKVTSRREYELKQAS